MRSRTLRSTGTWSSSTGSLSTSSGVPVRAPQVEELIRAASETKAEAFEYRLAISDFPIAETIIGLPGMEGERFDEITARKILRSREGEAAGMMRERWAGSRPQIRRRPGPGANQRRGRRCAGRATPAGQPGTR